MNGVLATLSILGRVMLCVIFFMSAAGNKIPNFQGVVQYMNAAGVPFPEFLLVGAIVFLLAGSLLVVLGFQARLGAGMLLIFLAAATFYFHAFWKVPVEDAAKVQAETIQFMKNLALAGAMVFLIANGPGKGSLDKSA